MQQSTHCPRTKRMTLMSWFSGKVNGMPDFGQGDGWTASEWRRAPRRNVPARKLVSTNRGGYLNKAKAAKYSSGGGGDPYVVECNGRYYVAVGTTASTRLPPAVKGPSKFASCELVDRQYDDIALGEGPWYDHIAGPGCPTPCLAVTARSRDAGRGGRARSRVDTATLTPFDRQGRERCRATPITPSRPDEFRHPAHVRPRPCGDRAGGTAEPSQRVCRDPLPARPES